MVFFKCNVKFNNRKNFSARFEGRLRKPVNSIWAHSVMYYKYNYYTKFPVDVWEDFCGFLNGKTHPILLEMMLSRLIKHVNVNHSCTNSKDIFATFDNVPWSLFTFEPLIPSGRFRLDVNLTEGNRGDPLAELKIYFSVSDHRVERFWKVFEVEMSVFVNTSNWWILITFYTDFYLFKVYTCVSTALFLCIQKIFALK